MAKLSKLLDKGDLLCFSDFSLQIKHRESLFELMREDIPNVVITETQLCLWALYPTHQLFSLCLWGAANQNKDNLKGS